MSGRDYHTPTPFEPALICERVDGMLRERGWSWADLADKTGIDERTFRRWRSGRTVPQIGRLREAAAALGATYQALTDGLEPRGDATDGPRSGPRSAPCSSRDPWKLATDDVFFGRDATMRALEEALRERRSANVVGDRRIGKSSILKTWEQRARAMGYVAVGVSGDMTSGRSARALVKAITGGEAPEDPDGAADALLAWIAGKRRNGRPPLVLVDAFDELAGHIDGRFLRRLRGLVDGERLVLVLATSGDLSGNGDAGHTSPLDSLLSTEPIGLLEHDAAEALARRCLGPLAPETADVCALWCGRHPFYVKLLAHHLARADREGRTVEQAVDAFRWDAGLELRTLWRDHMSADERRALAALVRGEGISSKVGWRLQRRGVLTEEGEPFGAVLARWLEDLAAPALQPG